DNYCTVALELVINYELLREILSYGSQVKVVSPKSLLQQVEKELTASLQQYKI
ncbi:MAG: WYL domain-containing protein, partial [Thermoflexibacteraceae bacterium]